MCYVTCLINNVLEPGVNRGVARDTGRSVDLYKAESVGTPDRITWERLSWDFSQNSQHQQLNFCHNS